MRRPAERGIAIDLGTATVRIASALRVLAEEPCVVARTGRNLAAAGAEARAMVGRVHDAIDVIEPVAEGLIVHVDAAEELLRTVLVRAGIAHGWNHDIVVVAPTLTTDLQRRALVQCVQQVLPRGRPITIEAPMAAAIGADLAVAEPYGTMVVDVGRGATEAAVISLGEMVTSQTRPVGGAGAEQVVVAHLLAHHDLLVGQPTVERVVHLCSQPRCRSVVARGRDRSHGLPRAVRLDADEIRDVIAPVVDAIAEVARGALDAAPDTLASDVMHAGIVLTGGASRLHGVADRIGQVTGIDVLARDVPDRAVIDGARRCLAVPVPTRRRRR